MSRKSKNPKLEAVAKELAKDLKTEEDLSALSRELLKLTVETALNAEMDDHLGYKKTPPKAVIPATAATALSTRSSSKKAKPG